MGNESLIDCLSRNLSYAVDSEAIKTRGVGNQEITPGGGGGGGGSGGRRRCGGGHTCLDAKDSRHAVGNAVIFRGTGGGETEAGASKPAAVAGSPAFLKNPWAGIKTVIIVKIGVPSTYFVSRDAASNTDRRIVNKVLLSRSSE
ncbi:hypothetical protein L2E82_12906 [Cichorium intybus]|uniref:Uncharacterized protein n=1 Tax=Cichorium intybus TaxID=13427 RepID=A0ACB9GI49_CICIN|nr:hypothetical protein L2E82_12906 [Cichorium intybus]